MTFCFYSAIDERGDHESALVGAIKKKDVEMVQLLVDCRARVNGSQSFMDRTPLHSVCSQVRWWEDRDTEILTILLRAGADGNESFPLCERALVCIIKELGKLSLGQALGQAVNMLIEKGYCAHGLKYTPPATTDIDEKEGESDDDTPRSKHGTSPILVHSKLGKRIKRAIQMLMIAGARLDRDKDGNIKDIECLSPTWQQVFRDAEVNVKLIVQNALQGRDWDAHEVEPEVMPFLLENKDLTRIVVEYASYPGLLETDVNYSPHVNRRIHEMLRARRNNRNKKANAQQDSGEQWWQRPKALFLRVVDAGLELLGE